LGNIYLSNPFNLGNLRLKNLSIKNIKLCKTNPISGTPKMNLTHYSRNRYDNNSGLLTMQKRSQNEPKRTQPVVSKRSASNHQTQPALSEVEGFMVSLSNPRKFKNTPPACLKSHQIRTEFQRQKTPISSLQAYRCIGSLSYYTRCKRRFLSVCRTSCMAYIHTIDTLLYPLKKWLLITVQNLP
jgi:hypothetical protein